MEFHSSFGESWQVCTKMYVSFQTEVRLQPSGRQAGIGVRGLGGGTGGCAACG